jgi:hypothetical protein
MKTWVLVAVLAVGPLSACGPSQKLRQVRAETNALREETDALRAEQRYLSLPALFAQRRCRAASAAFATRGTRFEMSCESLLRRTRCSRCRVRSTSQ